MEYDAIGYCERACDPVAMLGLNRKKTFRKNCEKMLRYLRQARGLLKEGDENRKPRSLAQVSEDLCITLSYNIFLRFKPSMTEGHVLLRDDH